MEALAGKDELFVLEKLHSLNYWVKWKTTSIFRVMKTTSICRLMEDDLNLQANGRRPQFFGKMEDDLNFQEMEDDLNFWQNRRRPQFLGNGRRPQFVG